MSAVVDLITPIRARIIADTGSGGLFNASAPLLTACYAMQAPQLESVLPYMVIIPVSASEIKAFAPTTGYAEEYLFQFDIYTARSGGVTAGGTVAKRLRVVIDRWAPTVSTWAPSELLREGGQVFVEEENYHTIEEYRCLLAKA